MIATRFWYNFWEIKYFIIEQVMVDIASLQCKDVKHALTLYGLQFNLRVRFHVPIPGLRPSTGMARIFLPEVGKFSSPVEISGHFQVRR